ASNTVTYTTGPGFLASGDEINLTYSWDLGGDGGQLVIGNLTQGTSYTDDVPNTVTMDMGSQNQNWILGAAQDRSVPNTLNNIDKHFHGEVELFSLSDTRDNMPPVGDGYVDGTSGNDLIDLAYTGDPQGDRIDNNDALLPGDAPNDDRVRAGDGDDTVFAGLGDDTVHGGAGDDLLYGGPGDDVLHGGHGNDTFFGGEGQNVVYGGADRDVIIGGNAGDVIDGGETGDDYDTLDLTGAGPLRVVYSGDNPENGTVEFLDADRNVTGHLTFTNIENVIPCFTPGTMVATPRGERMVEDLRIGDKVITRDNGIQEIRWIGRKDLDHAMFSANPHLRPVLIRQGSLGNGLPERDMLVSPNHRVLVANDRTALYFDEHEVLVAAKHLVGTQGIAPVQSAGTAYIHFMCDRHEVVLSNGAWTESFQPGDYTLKGMGNAQRTEIYELFPELKTPAGVEAYAAARKTLKRHEAMLLTK
ncbi:MAG: Hint domain-containing protein, partial [Gemmobacter sp.]|nr:Hint domain-containing protein [Gemmobacter sp.]